MSERHPEGGGFTMVLRAAFFVSIFIAVITYSCVPADTVLNRESNPTFDAKVR
ncbi:hypothetical protein KGO06_00065 [Patescibacteria group bacterium]|nr:hypothetical protein [Patescibacteria group bacterium]